MEQGVTGEETERVKRLWDRAAPNYDKGIAFFERRLFTGGREWACAQASGDVLEVAVGTGRNLPYYPDDTRLTAIELSPAMLEIARRRAADISANADLRLGDAQHLDFADDSFDTVVCTLSLCSVPDDAAVVSEVFRVLRPGGRFIALEHVRSPNILVRLVQTVLDWPSVRFQGDHQLREPLHHLRHEGFAIEHLARLKWGIVERVIAAKPS